MIGFNETSSENNMQGVIQQHISSLLTLAHDRTEAGRIQLAEKLTDVFFAENVVLSRREETLLNDFLDELLKSEHTSVRKALVERFAAKIDAPRTVALRMASSPIAVAQGVLQNNQSLLDDDLITIVETKGATHAKAIAARRVISEAVADALVETGDLKVMHIVAENLGARLSRHAIEILVESARLSALLHKPLLERPEISPDTASSVYWWMAHDLRRTTMTRFGFGPGKLESELTKAIDQMLSSHFLQKDETQAMEHLADWLAERGAIKTETLPQILRAGYYKLFAITLGRMVQLETAVIEAMMTDKGSPMFAALCKAVSIDKGRFTSLFLMARGGRSGEQVVNPRELSQAIAAFDRMTPEIARSMVQTWRMDPATVLNRIGRDDNDGNGGCVAISKIAGRSAR